MAEAIFAIVRAAMKSVAQSASTARGVGSCFVDRAVNLLESDNDASFEKTAPPPPAPDVSLAVLAPPRDKRPQSQRNKR
jgi:hypothetical protein